MLSVQSNSRVAHPCAREDRIAAGPHLQDREYYQLERRWNSGSYGRSGWTRISRGVAGEPKVGEHCDPSEQQGRSAGRPCAGCQDSRGPRRGPYAALARHAAESHDRPCCTAVAEQGRSGPRWRAPPAAPGPLWTPRSPIRWTRAGPAAETGDGAGHRGVRCGRPLQSGWLFVGSRDLKGRPTVRGTEPAAASRCRPQSFVLGCSCESRAELEADRRWSGRSNRPRLPRRTDSCRW
jgi:hypothetical protein